MKTYPSRLAMIAELPPGSIGAEIGVYRADFSEQVLRDTSVAHLYLVDPWTKQANYKDTINDEDQDAHYWETVRKMRPYTVAARCTIIRGFSAEVAATNKQVPPLDWVFVDGYHAFESALEDITAWSKRLTPDGVIFAHDAFDGPKYGHQGHAWYSGVLKAIDVFTKANPEWQFTGISAEDLPTAKLERKK